MAILDAQGTTLSIAGSAGAAITTMTATAGYPTILTKASHGLSAGDIGTLSAFAGDDAALMNDEVVVVKYVTTNTFAVDIDTTGATLTAANGTITPLDWLKVGTITDFNLGPARSERERTTLADDEKRYKLGMHDEGTYTFNVLWDNEDVGLDAVIAAYDAGTETCGFKITFSDGEVITLENGYVLNYSIGGGVDGDATGTITIRGTRAA